jgi:hypothetical protein
MVAILDGVDARRRAKGQATRLVEEAFGILASLGLSQEQEQGFREVAAWD